MGADGGRAGESSRCEDPAPTGGIAGNCHQPTYASRTSKGNSVEADNDTACRVAIKPRDLMGATGRYGMRIKPAGNGVKAENDATRRVATSFEKRENRV